MTNARQVARNLEAARQRLDAALAAAADMAVSLYHDDRMTETEIARELGVNRLTVRRWLGK